MFASTMGQWSITFCPFWKQFQFLEISCIAVKHSEILIQHSLINKKCVFFSFKQVWSNYSYIEGVGSCKCIFLTNSLRVKAIVADVAKYFLQKCTEVQENIFAMLWKLHNNLKHRTNKYQTISMTHNYYFVCQSARG
jgi:hypothetical protein